MDISLGIDGSTHLVGLIGSPVARSSSPAIHNAVFSELGCNYAYVALDVADGRLEAAVRGLEALGFPYLHEVSRAAEIMGAVNVVAIQNGLSLGDNADGAAFMRNLVLNGVSIIGKKITVLGAGGAASALVVQAALDGVAEIDVFNRDDEYVVGGRELIERLADHSECTVSLYDLADKERLRASIAESALLANATNVGTSDVPGCLIDASLLSDDVIVADMVYVPRETELIKLARAHGNQVVDGVGVFLQQAAISERLWFGLDMPVDYVRSRFF